MTAKALTAIYDAYFVFTQLQEFTLQFMNMYGCEFIVRLSLAAEWIGICNFSWLLFHIVSRLCCRSVMQAKSTMHSHDDGSRLEDGQSGGIPQSPTGLNRILHPEDHFVSSLNSRPLTWFDYLKYCW